MAGMDWDLSSYFPRFRGPEHVEFVAALRRDLSAAAERLASIGELGPPTLQAWEGALLLYEELSLRVSHLTSYARALAAADGSHPEYRQGQVEAAALHAELGKLEVRVVTACGEAAEGVLQAWLQRPRLAGLEHFVRRCRERAGHSLAPALEELALDLGVDGVEAWGRLYERLTATLSFELPGPAGPRRLPLSALRALLEGPDRARRAAAFEAGQSALRPLVPTLGAALNHIAGTRLTLAKKRGYADALEPALFGAGITRRTLSALLTAVERERDVPARILRFKARQMGLRRLAWFDLGAPIPLPHARSAEAAIDWPAALARVGRAFARYPALAHFFERAVERRWFDFSVRAGKRPGAFCTSSPLVGESRVFMTFQGTFSDVSTLAHEVGHAFHAARLVGVRQLARRYPMTLAETASTFAELILAEGLSSDPETSQVTRAEVLAHLVNDGLIFLVDIPARFAFEVDFHREREHGEVTEARLSELMVAAQQRCAGELLDPSGVDPLYWAAKLHFFLTHVSFYNFPYTFGYLLSRGLFAEFVRQGPAFLPRYEAFLQRSGAEDPEALVRSVLGVELEEPEFWQGSIRSLLAPLARLEGEAAPAG